MAQLQKLDHQGSWKRYYIVGVVCICQGAILTKAHTAFNVEIKLKATHMWVSTKDVTNLAT